MRRAMTESLEALLNLPGKVEWDEQQSVAITRCSGKDRIVPVTGAAGTGKTLIIKEVERVLTETGLAVQSSAPTGKAAKRIKESTGLLAMTNHRLLGYGMPIEQKLDDGSGVKETVVLSTGPRFDNKTRLPFDVLLCDEYAMVNNELHRGLLAALKPGGRICMFGDLNQLKPIEEDRLLQASPSCFEQILKKFNGIELTTQHRTAEGSGIYENAVRILKGKLPIKRPDFIIVNTGAPIKALTDHVRDALDDNIDYSRTEHQIITCMNKTWVGTKKLNPLIQQLFWNNEFRGISIPRWKWDTSSPITVQIGTKVVYTANTYDMGNGESVFNGEIGTIVAIDHDDGSIDIDFVDRVVSIPPLLCIETPRGHIEYDPRMNIDLAYVLTTHKMQGSECQHAIYIMNRSTLYGQSRRNLYTGVTRARKHCTVITDGSSMAKSLKFMG
jgi:exodeoxyribonuclease V alpha subunit